MPSLDGEWVSFGYAVTRHLDLVNARRPVGTDVVPERGWF